MQASAEREREGVSRVGAGLAHVVGEAVVHHAVQPTRLPNQHHPSQTTDNHSPAVRSRVSDLSEVSVDGVGHLLLLLLRLHQEVMHLTRDRPEPAHPHPNNAPTVSRLDLQIQTMSSFRTWKNSHSKHATRSLASVGKNCPVFCARYSRMAPDSKTVWGSPSAVSWSTIAGILELGDTCATQQTTTTVSDHQRWKRTRELQSGSVKLRKQT